jgi:Spy/CpxP family protein refolding chaperone
MNKKIGLLVVGLVTLAVGTLFAFAHNRDGFGGYRAGFGGIARPFMLDRIAAELELSDEQKVRAKQILEESKTRLKPLMKTMKEGRADVTQLGTDGTFDEARVNEIADSRAETIKRLFIEKERAKAQLFAVLTPEQREKAKQIEGKLGERMKSRFDRRHKGGNEKPAPQQD